MQPEQEREPRRFLHPDAKTYATAAVGEAAVPEKADAPLRRAVPRPPRRGKGLLRKLILFIFFAAVVSGLAYAGYIVSIVAKISTNSWQTTPLTADVAGRTNILVLGVGDAGHAGEKLTDTLMLVSLDANTQRLAQISIARDLRVKIPGYGYSKINAANAYGGVELAEATVTDTFGVPIDYYIQTNFSGVKDMVDAVGGLEVDVKERLVDREYPCAENQFRACGIDIQPGIQHMDGTRALQYARCRKGTCGNDSGRAARQQEILGLLRPKLTDPQLLLQANKLKQIVTAAQKGIQTDLGLVQLLQVANIWRVSGANQPVNLVLSTAPGGYLRSDPSGTSDLLPVGGDFSAISRRVQSVFVNDLAEIGR